MRSVMPELGAGKVLIVIPTLNEDCLLYTSDAADE